MTGKRAKSTSKPAAAKTSRGKLSIDQQFEERGREVERIEKELTAVRLHILRAFGDLVTQFGALSPREEQLVDVVFRTVHPRLLAMAMLLIRNWVEVDQSTPIPVKYLGRALKELGAHDEETGKNRIQIFAFFDKAPASAVLPPPEPGKPDYRVVASECTIAKGSGPVKKLKEEADKASKRVGEAVARLEALRLGDSLRSKAGKREKSYLRPIGNDVFDGWPKWPGETPGGSAT